GRIPLGRFSSPRRRQGKHRRRRAARRGHVRERTLAPRVLLTPAPIPDTGTGHRLIPARAPQHRPESSAAGVIFPQGGLMTTRRPKLPNSALAALLTTHGISHKSLAFRVNQLAAKRSMKTSYNHSSVSRWLGGSVPQAPVPQLIAQAFTERIGRTVTVEEIGMGAVADGAVVGWDFPRDRHEALIHVQAYWGTPGRPAGRFAVN